MSGRYYDRNCLLIVPTRVRSLLLKDQELILAEKIYILLVIRYFYEPFQRTTKSSVQGVIKI